MNRLRTSLLATACTLAVLSLASVVHAQGFGPPGGGGFGGPPGGFGGFGRGGPGGGPGGTETSHLLTLSLDSAVWDEIKITDDQLGKITRLRSNISKQSRQVRNTLREQRQQQEQQATAAAGGDADALRAARDAARQVEREAMSQSNDEVKADTEASLKKILNKPGQFGRVQAIDLQEAGPLVVARPDVAKALNLTPDQADRIQAVISQYTQGQRQVDQNRRDFFDSMRNNNNNGGGPGGPGGGGGAPGAGGPQANGAQGGQAGGGPGGGRGGRGGRGGNNNTPPMSEEEQAARRAQFQAAMEKAQTDSSSIKEKTIDQIGRILTKAQKTKFATMQGKAFDVALLNNGSGPDNPFTASLGGRGGRGPGGPGGRGPGGGPPGGGTPGTPGATAGGTTAGAAATPGGTTAATKGAQTKTAAKTATPTKSQTKTAASKPGTSK